MIHIVSDIHGCYHTLVALVDKVKLADPDAKFVFLGDYVDRGANNKEAVEFVISLQKEGAVCLRGNHDDVIDWLLNGSCKCDMREHVVGSPSVDKVYNWWMWNGLSETLLSYDVSDHLKTAGPYGQMVPGSIVIDKFRENVPQSHKEFFNNLDMFWENSTHFACHGFMRPEEELPRSLRFMPSDRTEETLWSRFRSIAHQFVPVETKWDKIGVFGHSPTNTVYSSPTPIVYDKIRLIDTGASTGNYLCAYCCEQDDWTLQATDSRDLK